MKGSDQYL